MADRTCPDPDTPTVADALAFVAAAKTWLEHTDDEAPGMDREASAVLMLDRAEEMLSELVAAGE